MKTRSFAAAALLALALPCAARAQQDTVVVSSTLSTVTVPSSVFIVQRELRVAGTPDQVFDAMTRDLSEWWDHRFSENPVRFEIEPRPGGSFIEVFDSAGNGVEHARVLSVSRGRLLRFEGPLGLTGAALQMVHTFEYEPIGSDSTLVKFTLRGSGDVAPGIPPLVDSVWHHFLVARLQPYLAGRFGR